MAQCTSCGAVGSFEDLENHTCQPPMKGTVRKLNGSIELIQEVDLA